MMKSLFKQKIIFDFDGTLVDVFLKYYKILDDYLKKIGIKQNIDFSEYKKQKVKIKKDHIIVENTISSENFDINRYVKFKRKNLERNKYLKYDVLIANCQHTLSTLLERGYCLEILSSRNSKFKLLQQLRHLKIRKYFSVINTVSNHQSKYDVLANRKDAIMIGDSPDDIISAQRAGMKSFFVLSGLYDDSDLSDKTGCNVISNINDLIKYIN